MKPLILIFALLSPILASNASAGQIQATKFSCGNVGAIEEWTIFVDLDKQLAGFFDNDTLVKVPLISTTTIESDPPEELFTFEGSDTSAGPGSHVLRIEFNKTQLEGTATLNLGENDQKVLTGLDGCQFDDAVTL
jgi:hypothetical protein